MTSLCGVTLPIGEEITIMSNGRVIAKILPNGEKHFFKKYTWIKSFEFVTCTKSRQALVKKEFPNGDIHIYYQKHERDLIKRKHFANGDIEYYGYNPTDPFNDDSSYLRRKSTQNGEEIEYYGKDIDGNICLQKIVINSEERTEYYEGKANMEKLVRIERYNNSYVYEIKYINCEDILLKTEFYDKGSLVKTEYPDGKVEYVDQTNPSKRRKI